MISKVSDFKLSEAILKSVCKAAGFKFVDVSIVLGEDDISSDCLFIGETENIGHTIYKIVANYINSSDKIIGQFLFVNGEEKDNFLLGIANMCRGMMYADNSFDSRIDELTLRNLYHKSMIWTIMKNIISPIYDVKLENTKIVIGYDPYIDIVHHYSKGEVKKDEDTSYPFIFINQIEDEIIQNAFLLIEALRANDLSPIETIKDIFESEICEKFIGILKISFNDEIKVNKFINVLIRVLGIDLYSFPKTAHILSKNMQKFSQTMFPENPLQWWYLGLIEAMLEGMRGTDWTVYNSLEPYIKDFWDKVEKVRIKRKSEGKDGGVPFDELLRIKVKQTSDNETDGNRTLQSLLSSNRVW